MTAHLPSRRIAAILFLSCLACRTDPQEAEQLPTGQFGQPGTGYTCQCSGWFPDWISSNPPAAADSFQLSQGYPLGIPRFQDVGGTPTLVGWDPPNPGTGSNAPWLAFDFTDPAERTDYIDALKEYMLKGMPAVDFVAQDNSQRRWYHVPMMTTSPFSRREPYRGTTKERPLNASEHPWMEPGAQLDSWALGYYNSLGGYTIGRVFHDPDPVLADPSAALFIDGALVFKLIFAEYDSAKIVPATDPLVGSPEWQVQDVGNPSGPLVRVRLLQVDVAVKDPRATQTGWVFGTYVYDKTMTSETVAWRRLRPVGLQWGNDPTVQSPSDGPIVESWTDESALPAVFQGHLGRGGRLNGPVDNPASSCLSCHSTAQVLVSASSSDAFRGAEMVPPGPCSNAQDMTWFRNIPGGDPFGYMSSAGTGCTPAPSLPSGTTLHGLDYSLQLRVALESALYYENPNPCQAMAEQLLAESGESVAPQEEGAMRMSMERAEQVEMEVELMKRMNLQDERIRLR